MWQSLWATSENAEGGISSDVACRVAFPKIPRRAPQKSCVAHPKAPHCAPKAPHCVPKKNASHSQKTPHRIPKNISSRLMASLCWFSQPLYQGFLLYHRYTFAVPSPYLRRCTLGFHREIRGCSGAGRAMVRRRYGEQCGLQWVLRWKPATDWCTAVLHGNIPAQGDT